MFTDSHLHFDAFEQSGVLDAVIHRAYEAGVRRMIAVGGSAEANARAIRIAERHDGIRATVGYDRDEAERAPDPERLRELCAHPPVVAIGETGLDYHYSRETAPAQKHLFANMLEIAAEADLPVVVHSREADEDTLALLREFVSARSASDAPPGVLHCFTGSMPFAEALLEIGLMIGFSGILTFKNADALRRVAAAVPDDRLLIETDAPYLAPAPHRGKRNEPAWVVHVAQEMARIRNVDVEHVARVTTENAERLFGWGKYVH